MVEGIIYFHRTGIGVGVGVGELHITRAHQYATNIARTTGRLVESRASEAQAA